MDSFWDFFWFIIAFFLLMAYLMVLFQILTDMFRDHELSGWWKAVWVLFLIFFPILTALVYLIARGRGMVSPKRRHASVYRLCSSAFMGLPCPRNAAGILGPSRIRRVSQP